MILSDNAKKQIEACRFCWMCRHICPVGMATGKEADTPRGRAVLCKYVLTGMDIKKEITGDMFDCCLCNNCASWCETGFEPAIFIREARTDALISDCLPEKVKPVVDRVLSTGTIYEEDKALEVKAAAKADVLLVLGETARNRQPEIARAAVSLLDKADVAFAVLANEPPVGAMAYDLVGEIAEVKKIAETFAAAVKAAGARTVVCIDPTDARFFKQECAKWGIELGEVFTITSYLADLVNAGKLKFTKPYGKTVTYHDPCRLARDLDETEPPRELLKAAGAELKEIFLNRKDTRCCGGEVLKSHAPQIVEKISRIRLDDAKRTGAEECITACPGCNQILGESAGAFVKNILCLLDECC